MTRRDSYNRNIYHSTLFSKISCKLQVPSAPANCQALIIDYLTLAKTRLSDLNETTDYIGLFNDYHETDEVCWLFFLAFLFSLNLFNK